MYKFAAKPELTSRAICVETAMHLEAVAPNSLEEAVLLPRKEAAVSGGGHKRGRNDVFRDGNYGRGGIQSTAYFNIFTSVRLRQPLFRPAEKGFSKTGSEWKKLIFQSIYHQLQF